MTATSTQPALRAATVNDIVKRLTGTPYKTTAATPEALGGGMGSAQYGIIAALDAAIEQGLVKVVQVRDTTYGKNIRFVAINDTKPVATIDSASTDLSTIYGAIAGTGVGVGVNGRSMTEAMDARIVTEGYRRIGDWTKRGPLNYTADIESHPQRCDTCVNGCNCEQGTPGCEHYGCWGTHSADTVAYGTCPGIVALHSATR